MQGKKDYPPLITKIMMGKKKLRNNFYLFHYISLSHYKFIYNAEILYNRGLKQLTLCGKSSV